MAPLLIVILIIAAAIGIYRCNASDPTATSPDETTASRFERTLQAPREVENAMQGQVDAINQRNQEMLQRY